MVFLLRGVLDPKFAVDVVARWLLGHSTEELMIAQLSTCYILTLYREACAHWYATGPFDFGGVSEQVGTQCEATEREVCSPRWQLITRWGIFNFQT